MATSEEDGVEVACEACEATIRIAKKPKHAELYWCDQECYDKAPFYGFSPVPKFDENSKRRASFEKKVCPTCGGPAKGRGFTHTEDCVSSQLTVGPKSSCTECGGPSHGRGFKHKANCSQKCQPYVPKAQRVKDEEEILS
jgi:hypothetical protein